MTIAITGATGHLGRLVIAALKDRVPDDSIIALARSPAKAADLGVAVRTADYDRPETLAPALAGTGTLLLISSSEIGRRTAQHRAIIDAAAAAGVARIVYTSVLHADTSALSVADEHRDTEVAVRDSGLPFTILRNGWYTENYAGAMTGAVTTGAVIGAAGNGRISSAARADYAEAAAAVLTGTGHDGRTYELAGDDAFTLADLAAEISRRIGRTIAYRNLSEAEYAAALTSVGVPADFAALIAGWDTATSQGALFDEGRQLSTLIGRPTTPLAATVAETVG